jgi:hypothetical protein
LGRVSPQDACEVCGRTFLVGEKVHSYVSVEGRHEVCELCVDRVAAAGWLPADQEGAEERLRAEAERKPGFLGRLFSRPQEDEERFVGDEGVAYEDEEPPAPRRREIHELETERYDVEADWRGEADEERDEDAGPSPVRRRLSGLFGPRRREGEPEAPHGRAADLPAPDLSGGRAERLAAEQPEGGRGGRPRSNAPSGAHADLPADAPHGHAAHLPSPDEVPEPETSPAPAAPAPAADASPAPLPDPAGRGMRPRRLQPDLSPTTRFERAVTRFNSSDAGRTAAGLTRTLGPPSVSVGDLAGAEDIVRITVAWELTWYQWGVDLGDELRPVFELARGFELSEIDSAARQWNASAHDGRIVMVAPPRREAENGRPVHR